MPPLDSELLPALRRHDPAAWDIVLRRHQLPLYTYTVELLRDNTAALDIVQDTFAAAVRHIATLRDDARFASWLFGIAHQKCGQHWRRVRRDESLFAPVHDDDDLPAEHPDPADTDPRYLLLRREQTEEFFALVSRLPAAQRSALLLHVIEDFSLQEIATIAGVPLGTVKSRLHHAKRALRQLMEATR